MCDISFFSLQIFANEDAIKEENVNKSSEMEVITIEDEDGMLACRARWCWNTGENTRQCTEWQEVPCNITIEGEFKEEPN